MITKTFEQPMDGRTVLIEITDDSIDFFFHSDLGNVWFYDIPKQEWKADYPRWQDHMNDKRWFTSEMEKFINKNT